MCIRDSPGTFSVTYDPNGGTGGITDGGIAPGTQYTVKSDTEANVTRDVYKRQVPFPITKNRWGKPFIMCGIRL